MRFFLKLQDHDPHNGEKCQSRYKHVGEVRFPAPNPKGIPASERIPRTVISV